MSSAFAAFSLKSDVTGEALYATRNYQPREVVLEFPDRELRRIRDRYTVQHPSGGHLYHPLLAKVSHSCEPNCEVLFPGSKLVALKAIAAGDAISFDYESTESEFAFPFECLCGAASCRKFIGV